MKQAIAENFYDKEISVVDMPITHDEEGGVVHGSPIKLAKFKGNVNFSSCGKIQEEYGLDYKVDMVITTEPDTIISVNNILSYQDKLYVVVDSFKRDSHIMLVAQIYQPAR